MKLIKNVDHEAVFVMKDLIEYQDGKVASMTLTQQKEIGLTLFAIAKGEGLSAHAATGDAFVTILEGTARIQIEDKVYEVNGGESIIMPSGKPHSLKAISNFKMLLTLVKEG